VALTITVAGKQVTATEETVGATDCTMTDTAPDFAVSSILVAVTVTVAAELDAVNKPVEVIVPPVVDHITTEL